MPATDAGQPMTTSSWRQQLHRLEPLESDLALLPIGSGQDRKGPLLSNWPLHNGFTITELQASRSAIAVGARTGATTGPLLAFDFDGATAVELGCSIGCAPWDAITWQIHRDNDPDRLKVLFRPTPEQLLRLPQQRNGGIEFEDKVHTRPKAGDEKGEALEVFFSGGRQVILLGHHHRSGGHYLWPDGLGPETFAPPPEAWLEHAIAMAEQFKARRITPAHTTSSTTRSRTRRLDPCPICGRHSGAGGSDLWCEQTVTGLLLCMPGSTFSAEQRHGPLRIGQVIDGWALLKRSPHPAGGDALTFRLDRPRPDHPETAQHHQVCSRSMRPARPGRTARIGRAA